MNFLEFAPIFKAMSDEKRLKIIDILSSGPLCACNILEHFDFSQPALSQHMKVLVDAGLVIGVRSGNWMHYSLVRERYEEIIVFIQQILGKNKEGLFVDDCDKCK